VQQRLREAEDAEREPDERQVVAALQLRRMNSL
jgi:hypothetical protein